MESKLDFNCNQNIGETLTQCKKMCLECFDYKKSLVVMKVMGNWSKLHSERSYLLQNPYLKHFLQSKILKFKYKSCGLFSLSELYTFMRLFNNLTFILAYPTFLHVLNLSYDPPELNFVIWTLNWAQTQKLHSESIARTTDAQ